MQTDQHAGESHRQLTMLGRDLDGSGDGAAVVTAVVDRARAAVAAPYGAAVVLCDDAPGTLVTSGFDEPARTAPFRGPLGVLELIAAGRSPLRCDDFPARTSTVRLAGVHPPIEALLGVPVRRRGDVLGAFYVARPPGGGHFTTSDEAVVAAMAAMAALGLDNARLTAREADGRRRAALLGEIFAPIRASLDLDDILAGAVAALGDAVSVDRCRIRLSRGGGLGPVEREWVRTGVVPAAGLTPSVPEIARRARRTGTLQWSDDFSGSPGGPGRGAAVAAPLRRGEELVGVVELESAEARRWTRGELALVDAAAHELAAAIHNSRLYRHATGAIERERAADARRRDLVTMVSHELRSPMTVIAGIADLLGKRADKLDEHQRADLIETLGREARRLSRLVTETLDLDRVDKGGLALALAPTDVGALVHESVADAGLGSRTAVVVEPGDASVACDRDRVKQVVLNLLSNADKFSPPGSTVDVTVLPRRGGVTIVVADRGSGVPEAQRHLLFRRYSRLDGPSEGKPGSGLGLYLSKEIVAGHGGTIWMRPGESGSEFCFRLPRRSE